MGIKGNKGSSRQYGRKQIISTLSLHLPKTWPSLAPSFTEWIRCNPGSVAIAVKKRQGLGHLSPLSGNSCQEQASYFEIVCSKLPETDLDVSQMSIFETSWRKDNLSANTLSILITLLFNFGFCLRLVVWKHIGLFFICTEILKQSYLADNNNYQR